MTASKDAKFFEVDEMRVTGDKQPLYYTSYGGVFDADLNNMHSIYTIAKTEPKINGVLWGDAIAPFEGGATVMCSTEWFEWDSKQIVWTDYKAAIDTYTDKLFETWVGPDDWGNNGYAYSNPNSPYHLGHQAHYDYNAIFIIAARDYLLQRNGEHDFLAIKNSLGATMAERIELAMEYQLNVLHGKDGLIIIDDPNNDATVGANSSTYWDVFTADGYKSAYVNVMFYSSLRAMADIESYRGNQEKTQYYQQLAEQVKTNINELFWDSQKGRYIMSIDKEGNPHDYGTTFLNVSAIAYGVADEGHAKQIYEWLDGDRIIEGDTSTGKDIYDGFVYAPRSNTLDVAAVGPPYYWELWENGTLDCTPGGNASYGKNIQNGGAIFYVSYYDIMGRIQKVNIDSGMKRFNTILEEFHKDQLRRRNMDSIATSDGVIGEFPESGIVPLVMNDGVMGLRVVPEGISITPALPKDMNYIGVREYWYNGQMYAIEISRETKKPVIEKIGDKFTVTVPAKGSHLISPDNQVIALKKGK